MSSQPIDHAERQRAIRELGTTFLVEASAGTGKTTLTIERILEAIRTGRATMEQIVAITFTEKAAAGLKMRLRDRMDDARRNAKGEERQRLELAMRQLERSHINTIHGFCSWLLKERPIEARVDPGFQVLDELETQLLREETWTEWIERQMEARPEVLKRALFAEISLSRMQEMAFELARQRERIDPALLVPSPYRVADGVSELDLILRKLNPELANCTDPSDAAFLQIRKLQELSAKLGGLKPYQHEYELIHSMHVRKNAGNKANWASADSLKRIKASYDDINAIAARRAAALLRDLCAWLRGFMAEFERAKALRGVLDFDDLLIQTRQLLWSDLGVRAEFQRRFRLLLVDEFQDTDPTQAEIVFLLAEQGAKAKRRNEVHLEPGKLFLVGDPKQSIYRFRRADIEVYEAAKDIIRKQGDVLTIRQSFRTVSSLLAWLNITFEQLIQPPKDGGMYQPKYVPLHEWPDHHSPSPRVCVLEPTADQKKQLEDANVDIVRSIEAREVARLIQHLTQSSEWKLQGREDKEPRAPRYRDFAVLLHSPATSLAAYESAFQEHGIPYQVEGGKDYFQSQEVRAACALLLALDDPMNTRELVGVLRSAVFGLSDQEIYLWTREQPLDYLAATGPSLIGNALTLLKALHLQRNAHSLAGFVELIYRELKLPELFSLLPHGEQRVANLMKLLSVARRVQEAGILSLRAFVDYLRTTALERSEEGQSPSAEAHDDVVSLLSIHKAKGLEWGIVILGDLGGTKRAHHATVLPSRDGSEIAFRLGAQWETENHESLHAQEKLRQEAEELRLLYVAATRARDYLVLPWFASKGHYLGKLKQGFNPEHMGETIAAFFRRNAAESKRDAGVRKPSRVELDTPDPTERTTVERLVAERVEWIAAHAATRARLNEGRDRVTPSRLAEEKAEAADRRLPSEAGDGETANAERAKLFGTMMHEVLATMDFSKPDTAEALWQQRAARAGVCEEDTKRGVETLRRFVGSDLFRRIRQGKDLQREMPFAYVQGGTLFEGTMDLVFREDTHWVLVDYKTDRISAKEAVACAERYRPQLEAYADALQTLGGTRAAKLLAFLDPGIEVQLD
jgi:ATP-dependent helicase/nuclease subunit A